jgi:RNA-directed DNA polymerase
MKEPHGEGPASHADPESCARGGNDAGEALTGAHASRVLSCEINDIRTPPALTEPSGNIGRDATREPRPSPAQSKAPHVRGNSTRGNRESPSSPGESAPGRPGKGRAQEPGANDLGQSNGRTVPAKPANRGATAAPEESVEGRRPAKGNASRSAALRTQGRVSASTGLRRVRQAARRDRRARFTALLHHMTVDLLRESFFHLKRQAAPGVDDLTWQRYADGLEDRLRDLHRRVHSGTYRARPSRRIYLPKPDGRKRPIGIAALEDKIVQQATAEVLSAVYEADFKGFSYGFRPGRGPHQALDALWVAVAGRRVNWVLDCDIRSFFDSLSHSWMERFLQHRIADPRVLRLVSRWLRAGVSEDGTWMPTTKGTPQGAVLSPLLANVYLHYVLDTWVERWRKESAAGTVVIVRYADDFIMGFEKRADAERLLAELRARLARFDLELHPEKTRLFQFGRHAAEDRKKRGQGKPETFDFLGFTHICGRTRTGRFTVRRLTIAERQRRKLKAVREALAKRRHRPIPEQGRWLRAVVQGHLNYYAVPGNLDRCKAFMREVNRAWLHALRRRGQRHPITWDRMKRHIARWIPAAKILHPYPDERFNARHSHTRGKNRMR